MIDLPASPAVEVRIDARASGDQVAVVGVLLVARDFHGRYELDATKDGPTGHSTIRQGGAASAAAGQTLSLSSLTLGGLAPGGRWSAVLRLYEGDTLVAEARAPGARP
jgi:hypothetical protein